MQRLLATLFFVLCSCVLVLAQTETAVLSGRVTDPSGAVVVGASVTATNHETKVVSEAKTNAAGIYTFLNLAPGPYQLAVRAQGFRDEVIERLVLHVQDRVSQDIALQVGSASETVTVSAETVPLNTQDATVGTVLERQVIQNMPLNGQTFQGLITLAPGVALVAAGSSSPGQFVVNGQRTDTSYFTLDGVSANAAAGTLGSLGMNGTGSAPTQSATGGYNNIISVDAIEEFRISTSTFAPEFGRTPGGQVSVVSRGGTSTFHGDAFDYLRNTVLDANDWFLNTQGKPRGVVQQNDFGGVFGGPAIQNKLFFFASYEGLRLNAPTPSVKNVPVQAARNLAAAANLNGVEGFMAQFLNAYPLPDNNPSTPCTSFATCLANYTASFPTRSRLDSTSARVDYTLSKRMTLFGRYSHAPSTLAIDNSVTETKFNEGTDSWTAGLTRSFGNTINNDTRFNYTRTTAVKGVLPLHYQGDLSTIFPSGFAQPPSDFLQGSSKAIPPDMAVQIGGFASDTLIISPAQANNGNNQLNITDTLSWIKGHHGLKFGVDFRQFDPFWNQSSFNWNNQFAISATVAGSPANNCPAAALPAGSSATTPGFVCGQATLSNLQHNYPQDFRFRQYSFFGQDTWKVTPRFTVTYGARWEINPPFDFTNGHAGFSIQRSTFNLSNLSTLQLNPFGKPAYQTTWNHVSPRLALAYEISDDQNWGSVIRTGYGIFYDTGAQTGTLLATPWNTRFNNIGSGIPSVAFVSFPISASSSCTPTANSVSCAAFATPVAANLTPPVSNGGQDAIIDPNFTLPYVHQMNLTFEQRIGAAQTFTISYVGALGRKLIGELGYPASQGNPAVFSLNGVTDAINVFGNYASSSYHALQTKFQRQFSAGLAGIVSYTWSHSIDNASSNSGASSTGLSFLALPVAAQASSGAPVGLLKAASDFDIRHSVGISLVYNIPTPFKDNAISRALLGGWSFDPIYHYQTALPVDIFTGTNGSIGGTSYAARPNLIPGVPLYVTGDTCAQQYLLNQGYYGCPGGFALNLAPVSASQASAAGCVAPTGGVITGASGVTIAGKTANAKGPFCTPAAVNGQAISGNFGRNVLRAFSLTELDFSVHRDIPIYERLHLRFQADIFNVFNEPQFGPYTAASANLNNANFGFATQMANSYAGSAFSNGAGLNPIFATGAPRNFQFALKVIF